MRDWLEHNRELRREKRNRQASNDSQAAHTPIEWSGTLRELGDLIDELHTRNKIKARSRTNAFEQVCRHFTFKGKAISHRSVITSLKNREDVER
jgi:hypothetical protein